MKRRLFRRCTLCLAAAFLMSGSLAMAQTRRLPALKVSENHRFLETADGKPFFYLADTGWELFHRLDRKQASEYLAKRAAQGFNVIQCVALAELDGLTDPNAYGRLPLIDKDPTRPDVTPGANPNDPKQYDYWDHVEYIINEANRRGIYIGFLPAWGRWLANYRDPSENVFNASNAEKYGEFLGKRFGKKSIIWILGGDRPANGYEDTWRALARGIAIGVNGREDYSNLIMTLHPNGGGSSATWFHNDRWLTFNMLQTGHSPADRAPGCWEKLGAVYEKDPVKPVLDGESLYEDHPIGFRLAKQYGYSTEANVRQRVYWDVFAGGFGQTYGDHSVWQMYAPGRKPINGPLLYWYEALDRPGANEMKYLRLLMESRPYFSRVPDQSLVADALSGADHIGATRGDGYTFIYTAQGRPFTVNLGKVSGDRVKAWWFNPRDGSATALETFDNKGTKDFKCPTLEGLGSDWVLVLDDASRNLPPPGSKSGERLQNSSR